MTRAGRAIGLCACWLALLALWPGWVLPAEAAAPRGEQAELEAKLKAAFVLNFARFVEWPTNAFASPTNALVIGILGDDPFGPAMEATVEGKTVEQHPVRVERYTNVSEALGAHVLFVSASERPDWRRLFQELGTRPVLTVSDVEGFIEAGGMINLKKRQDMLRFDINRSAAENSGLKISSKLLKLADNNRR